MVENECAITNKKKTDARSLYMERVIQYEATRKNLHTNAERGRDREREFRFKVAKSGKSNK